MTRMQGWFWFGVIPVACGAVLAWFGSPPLAGLPTGNQAAASPPAATRVHDLPIVGSAGCSARSCHGSVDSPSAVDPDKCSQNEYIRWMNDPHANAYEVLKSERSQRIITLLNHGSGKTTAAHEDSRCLACHTNPPLAPLADFPMEVERTKSFEREKSFGIGCESCHGNAEKWLVPHTNMDWRKLSPKEKWDKYSMVPVTEPVPLARKCVGCHVGAPPSADKSTPLQDVNHDLIAAGHPRLDFEFNSFYANMPPHWRPRKKDPAQLWAVGQVVAAQASLDLLGERAHAGPWPEFTEYDCFACHHSLTQKSWRQQANPRRKLGALAWGSWYFPMVRELADVKSLDDLEALMQQPLPDRARAGDHARLVHKDLQALLDQLAGSNSDKGRELAQKKILDRLRNGSLKIDSSWDSAEQLYLSLYALNETKPDPTVARLLTELTPIRAFPAGYDSPVSWDVNGLRTFRPKDFIEKLRLLAR